MTRQAVRHNGTEYSLPLKPSLLGMLSRCSTKLATLRKTLPISNARHRRRRRTPLRSITSPFRNHPKEQSCPDNGIHVVSTGQRRRRNKRARKKRKSQKAHESWRALLDCTSQNGQTTTRAEAKWPTPQMGQLRDKIHISREGGGGSSRGPFASVESQATQGGRSPSNL